VALLAAAAANTSATWAASVPAREKMLSVVAMISAARGTAIPAAAARSVAPLAAPPRMSSIPTPALASSSIAPAASLAENDVALPRSSASCRKSANCAVVASVTALTALIWCSKSAASFVPAPRKPRMPAPMPTSATPAPCALAKAD
jgi:hypothetical protein